VLLPLCGDGYLVENKKGLDAGDEKDE
jgi:hypothetical protein